MNVAKEVVAAAKEVMAAAEFEHTQLIRSMWRDKITEAQERQGILFDLENNDASEDPKEVKVGSYEGSDGKEKQYRFIVQECQAGGDWENPVLYYRVQLHDKSSRPMVDLLPFGGDNCFVYIPMGGNSNIAEFEKSRGGKALGATNGNDVEFVKIDKQECKKDLMAFLEKLVKMEPAKDADYGDLAKVEFKKGRLAGALKTFREIRLEAAADGQHHHLRLTCAVCGDVNTCRCMADKVEVVGICDGCAEKEG